MSPSRQSRQVPGRVLIRILTSQQIAFRSIQDHSGRFRTKIASLITPMAKASKRRKRKSHHKGSDKKWSGKVKTVSTYPPSGLYTKDAQTIARVMATKKVSPKGIGSAIRMVQFFINRAGKTLSVKRKREL